MSASIHGAGKDGTALIINVTFVECESVPLVPVTVNVLVPTGVDVEVLTVMVEEPEPLTDVGTKFALAPLGKPAALKFTVPLKPLMLPMLTV